mmetsp:Transcript_75451/g.194501  ORF Transcript_75451/g.194501 Transcript_75451/m.194501 type:complete len:305 (+) Transcript_75451:389-1303(+)
MPSEPGGAWPNDGGAMPPGPEMAPRAAKPVGTCPKNGMPDGWPRAAKPVTGCWPRAAKPVAAGGPRAAKPVAGWPKAAKPVWPVVGALAPSASSDAPVGADSVLGLKSDEADAPTAIGSKLRPARPLPNKEAGAAAAAGAAEAPPKPKSKPPSRPRSEGAEAATDAGSGSSTERRSTGPDAVGAPPSNAAGLVADSGACMSSRSGAALAFALALAFGSPSPSSSATLPLSTLGAFPESTSSTSVALSRHCWISFRCSTRPPPWFITEETISLPRPPFLWKCSRTYNTRKRGRQSISPLEKLSWS